MATVAELDEAVRTARQAGCPDVVLLKCTSTYPATPEDSNLATLTHMREMFGSEVGVSDHTAGIGGAVCAVAFGATVIEKHFTLRRSDGGVDSAFSLEPDELSELAHPQGEDVAPVPAIDLRDPGSGTRGRHIDGQRPDHSARVRTVTRVPGCRPGHEGDPEGPERGGSDVGRAEVGSGPASPAPAKAG
jgi:hypothetical protein